MNILLRVESTLHVNVVTLLVHTELTVDVRTRRQVFSVVRIKGDVCTCINHNDSASDACGLSNMTSKTYCYF